MFDVKPTSVILYVISKHFEHSAISFHIISQYVVYSFLHIGSMKFTYIYNVFFEYNHVSNTTVRIILWYLFDMPSYKGFLQPRSINYMTSTMLATANGRIQGYLV